MIIKGQSCTGPEVLGPYLTTSEKNERAQVLEIKGTVSQDIVGALTEMDAYAEGTQCGKPLYHLKLSPEPPYRLTREQLFEAADIVEQRLGLEDHARVIVVHEYKGREHFHIVWTRIDLENLRAVPDSHNYRKHEEAAREMERRFGHPRVQGVHAEREGERPDRSLTHAELRQQERTGIKAKDIKLEVTELYGASGGNAEEFAKALEENGYVLAKGDKRDFVIIDRAGGDHNLVRRIQGMKAGMLREFMAPIDREGLPSVDEAKVIQFERENGLPSIEAFENWDDRLAEAAIKHDIEHEPASKPNKQLQNETDAYLNAVWSSMLSWDDAVAASGILKAIRDEEERWDRIRKIAEARHDAAMAAGYARSESYTVQTTAALREHTEKQSALNLDPRPQHPDVHQIAIARQFDATALWATAPVNEQMIQHHDSEPSSIDIAFGAVPANLDYNELSRSFYDRTRLFVHNDGPLAADERMAAARVDRLWPTFPQWLAFESMPISERPVSEINDRVDYKALAGARYTGIKQIVGNEFEDVQAEKKEQQKNEAKDDSYVPNFILVGSGEIVEEREEDATKKKREEELLKRHAEAAAAGEAEKQPTSKPASTVFDGLELTEEQQAHFDRLIQSGENREVQRDGPDTQRGASGEGRSRSR